MDMIEKKVRDFAKRFYNTNKISKPVRLLNAEGQIIVCEECKNEKYKLYTKFGGEVYDKKGRLASFTKTTYNFVCKCGRRLVLREGEFSYAKIKYGCNVANTSTKVCPDKKIKMDQKCLKCRFCYEK